MGLTFAQVRLEIVASGVTSVYQGFVGTTAGSILFAHVLTTTDNNPCTVTDSNSDVWTPLGHVTVHPGSNQTQLFWAANPSGGGISVTAHSPVSTTMAIYLFEYTGQAASSPIDAVVGSNVFTEIGVGNVVFGPVTASYSNETLILAGRNDPGTVTITSQDGATVRSAPTNLMLLDRNISTAGSYTETFSTNVSGCTGELTLVAVKSTTSALPPSSGGSLLGGSSDFKFKL